MTTPFVHLRLHSEFSINDSIIRVPEAVKAAVADGMPALALTDLNNLFGAVRFYRAALEKGVKPVIGCDLWLSDEKEPQNPSRLLLLCQNYIGYLNLCTILTRAFQENFILGRAEVQPWWLDGMATEGLIALSGAQYGEVGRALLSGGVAAARPIAAGWAKRFPERFYLEVQRVPLHGAERQAALAVHLALEMDLPVVATHPVQFLKRESHPAHEVRVCIAEGELLADQSRPVRFSEEHYFKSAQEMAALFHDLPEALENSVEIARRCSLDLPLGKNHLPDFPTPEGMTLDDFMAQQAAEGMARRLAKVPASAPLEKYQAQLDFEVETIRKMGFSGYFLIVADFINWAKENDIPVGPGRGSGAGSLVAYSLGITDLDPIRYDLLFERFLNPERVSMPDFDVDFCQEKRDRVIDYVKEKYGFDSVSQIATFGRMAAKAVVRDVGRVLGMPYGQVDKFAKLIPAPVGKSVTLKVRTDPEDKKTIYAREEEPAINQREEEDEEIRALLHYAMALEGITRNVGMHAGGVLIAPGKLTDFCPLYRAGPNDPFVSQFDKDDVEKIGLVKFDFLGLRTLTIIDETVKSVRRLYPDVSLDMATLPLDDAATYRLIMTPPVRGTDGLPNTTAVFQLESRGMKELVKRLMPDNIDDIIALVALYRPGPLDSGMVDDYVNRKHGRAKPDYLHPSLEGVLKPTYGVIVYQEQVMQIAQVLSGYSLGAADLLRRAMGKKKASEMAAQREIFVKGAVERGVEGREAEYIFDLIEKFAGYGFNKSHSAAYAVVSYQTAYLKAHYPAAFVAATLSSEMDKTDKVFHFYNDARANALEVLPPDVNESDYRFRPEADGKSIRYGLGGVKGTGEAAIATIVEARRQGGPFRDFFDFCRRVDRKKVNRRVVEALILAGAFDVLHPNRASLFSSVKRVFDTVDKQAEGALQVSLFGEMEPEVLQLDDVPEWNTFDRLTNEKKALGFYFSGHLFDAYRDEVRRFAPISLAQVKPQSEPLRLAGIVNHVRLMNTQRGRLAFVTIDDGTAQLDVPVGGDLLQEVQHLLKDDALVILRGKVREDRYRESLRIDVDELLDLASARGRFASCLELVVDAAGPEADTIMEILRPFAGGGCPVRLRYRTPEAECVLELGEAHRIALADELFAGLGVHLPAEAVSVAYL